MNLFTDWAEDGAEGSLGPRGSVQIQTQQLAQLLLLTTAGGGACCWQGFGKVGMPSSPSGTRPDCSVLLLGFTHVNPPSPRARWDPCTWAHCRHAVFKNDLQSKRLAATTEFLYLPFYSLPCQIAFSEPSRTCLNPTKGPKCTYLFCYKRKNQQNKSSCLTSWK